MNLVPFVLEEWLGKYRDSAEHNLALSTGPKWTLAELRALMTDAERAGFDGAALTYCPTNGREPLRAALAALYGASPEEIQVFTGGAEALLALFAVAAEPGANVLVPVPSFAPFVDIPRAVGLEVRPFRLRHEDGFAVDVEEVAALADSRTKLILVNTPHNPSGATTPEDTMRALESLADRRGIPLVVDEVYHPIYHGEPCRSAGEYTRATVLGDFSKSFSLPGLRIGWMLERDAKRRRALANAHGYFTVSTNMLGELLAEVAVRNRETIWGRTTEVSDANLAVLEQWCAAHADRIEWRRPHGSMTAFPRLRGVDDARPFCIAAAERGVLLAPGDCFGAPAHFRIGFGLDMPRYREVLGVLGDVLTTFEASSHGSASRSLGGGSRRS